MCVKLWMLVGAALAASAPAAAVMGGAPADVPQSDAAVVFVQKHGRSARLEGLKDDRLGYYSFFGVRYAEPPVGPRRFQRPVRRYLSGELNATYYCQPCPQADPWNPQRIIGNEDCLCLNIYAPKMPGDEQGSPVIFFIHGGNYKSGSTSAYGGQHLTQKDTILVTAQYRLGSLGYFSTGEKDASGNAGLFDLRTAMTWVNDYISFFGGDPSRVVVMGQGSGGAAASLMALSSEGRSGEGRSGGARGVAALSGTALSPGAVRAAGDPADYAKQLADRTGCPDKPPERLLICLRQLPFEKIVEVDSKMTTDMVDTKKFLQEISGRSGAGARVEGTYDERALPPLVAEQPSDSMKNQQQQQVQLLTGVTSAETSRAVFGKYSKFLTDKLASVKDFIKEDLMGGLQGVVSAVGGLVPARAGAALPLPDYYQALFDNSLNAVDGLSQIAEATGDALFNFPAYQTVKAWSAGGAASSYLYSFEYAGNLTKGAHFLPGVPLADNGNATEAAGSERAGRAGPSGPAHGDELAYLFEPLDARGQPLGGEVSAADARVRDNFVGLIAKFAHNLGAKDNTTKPNLFNLPFSKEGEQFIKINEDVTLDKNFRFCQMGLWGNIGERISGALCKDVIGSLLNLPKMTLPVTIPVTPKLPLLPNLLGDLRGSKTTPPRQVVQVTRATTKKPKNSALGLGGLFNGL